MKTKHLLALIVGFSMAGFVGAAVGYDKHTDAQNITPNDNTSYKPAKIGLHRDEGKPGRRLHNELVDELLTLTQKAKSSNPDIIDQILLDLENWNANTRPELDKRSDSSLKLYSFTMMAYLLDKLGRFDEIPKAYDTLYPEEPIEKQLFLKHHVAAAYIKMGAPQKAVDLMADVIERQPFPHTGTLILIAHANLAAANYNEVITTADALLKVAKSGSQSIIAINYKRAAYIAMDNIEKINEVNHILEQTYSLKGSEPALLRLGSPLLSYLPEFHDE